MDLHLEFVVFAGIRAVGGLFGFAITSALLAVVGTTLRGILRPISWSLLAIALGLLASNQFRTAAGQGTTGAVDVAQSPNTTISPVSPTPNTTISPVSPTPTSDRPLVQEGWQEVAEELEPIFSDAVADSEVPSPPSPDDILSGTQPTPTATSSPTVIVPVSPTPTISADSSNTGVSRQVSEPTQEPIQGFW
jgi:hypothetical protein